MNFPQKTYHFLKKCCIFAGGNPQDCRMWHFCKKSVLLFALVGNLGTFQKSRERFAKRFLRFTRGPLFVHLRLKVS